MDKPGLKRKPVKPVIVRGLNNCNPVLAEDWDDRIPHCGKIRILATEMRVHPIHHHVLAFSLSLRQSPVQDSLAIADNILPRGSNFRRIVLEIRVDAQRSVRG